MNLNFYHYSSNFSLKFSRIPVSKKRNEKESMMCLTPKPSQKYFEIIGFSSWTPSSPDHNPLDYSIGAF